MACSATGANRDIAYVKETFFKTTPANPMFKTLRTTGDSLKGTTEAQESQELRKGRTTSAPVKGRSSATGDIPVEFSYRSFRDFLAALMFNDWQDDTAPGAVAGQKVLTLGQNSKSFTIERFFSDMGLYRYYKGCMIGGFSISVPLEGKVTGSFNILGVNNPPVLTAPIAGETYDPETPHSTDQFTSFIGTLHVQRNVQNVLTTAAAASGDTSVAIVALTADIPAGTVINFGGVDAKLSATALAGATALAVTALPGAIAAGIIGPCIYPEQAIGYATQLDLAVANNMQQDYALFNPEAYCISPGKFGLTGTLGLYLVDGTFVNMYANWETFKIMFEITDVSGNKYRFTLPFCKMTDAPDGVSSPNTLTISFPFSAFGTDALVIQEIPGPTENRVLTPLVTIAGSTVTVTAHPEENATLPAGYSIRYTVDGADPTSTTGTAVTLTGRSGTFTLAAGTHKVRVRAFATALAQSPVLLKTFTV